MYGTAAKDRRRMPALGVAQLNIDSQRATFHRLEIIKEEEEGGG